MNSSASGAVVLSPTIYGTRTPSHRHTIMDFGKFYQTSYLDMNENVIKKGSLSSPNMQPTTSFHRPNNFSYSKALPNYGKAKRPGMLDLLRGGSSPRSPKAAQRRSRSTDSSAKSPERPADTEAVIKLSHYPSARINKDEQPAIEREDWPAPPATAVTTKNIVRISLANKYAEKESDSEDEENGIDTKIKKELDEIAKIQDSAMVKCIREDVAEQIKHEKKRLLDPRSASRTPSASKEPVQPPRFTSPVNASPSRCLVERPRYVSESAAKSSQPKSSTPVVHGAATSHRYRVKPGYSFGYVSKSLSTVPPGTPGAYVYDSFNHDSDDDDETFRDMERRMHVVDLVTRGGDDDDSDSVFERDSVFRYSSASNNLNFKRGATKRCSTMSDSVVYLKDLATKKSSSNPSTISNFDGSPFLNAINFDYRKNSESVLSLWEELLFEAEEPIPYSEINMSAENRRKGLSLSNLEKYLSNDEFEQHLGTTREEFYKLPMFKRNDVKQKAKLF